MIKTDFFQSSENLFYPGIRFLNNHQYQNSHFIVTVFKHHVFAQNESDFVSPHYVHTDIINKLMSITVPYIQNLICSFSLILVRNINHMSKF